MCHVPLGNTPDLEMLHTQRNKGNRNRSEVRQATKMKETRTIPKIQLN